MKTLPKTIFVRREEDGDETYLVACDAITDHGELGETRLVGEYKLFEILEVRTTVTVKNEIAQKQK